MNELVNTTVCTLADLSWPGAFAGSVLLLCLTVLAIVVILLRVDGAWRRLWLMRVSYAATATAA